MQSKIEPTNPPKKKETGNAKKGMFIMNDEMSDDELFAPLPCAEVIKAVERRKPRRIPLVFAKWWGEGLGDQYGERLKEFDRNPRR